jgi:sugar lactone lactonase YvrE
MTPLTTNVRYRRPTYAAVVLALALVGPTGDFPAALQGPSGGQLSLIAGDLGDAAAVNGPIDLARFTALAGVAVDDRGTVYVSDGHAIRRISVDGLVTTLAGRASEWGDADGSGTAARFNSPQGLATDAAGNVYVADRDNQAIRKITPDGVVTTLGGPAAGFFRPCGVAVDGAGNVFVADTRNFTVRRISRAGEVSTLAGQEGETGSANGPASTARFASPQGIAVDAGGNVYVTDFDAHLIRKISSSGVVTTLAGSSMGSRDGVGPAAEFAYPSGLAIDRDGNLYVGDSHSLTIRKITPAGSVTTIAGLADHAGSVDGPGATARFTSVHAVAVDRAGHVYATDDAFVQASGAARSVRPGPSATVRRIDAAGTVTTIAGRKTDLAASPDGVGEAARFESPAGIVADRNGTLYLTDATASTIRTIAPNGTVTTLAGQAGVPGHTDGVGSAARFDQPTGIVGDGAGAMYVTDPVASVIRKISSDGEVSTVAGLAGTKGTVDGGAVAARFTAPTGIARDDRGNLYVTDEWTNTIRRITPSGDVTTLAGRAGERGSADGPADRARFVVPAGIAVDRAGNVYVCDFGNKTIRKITPAGDVSTLAGQVGVPGSVDGPGPAAEFSGPLAIAVDETGTLYVSDATMIRRISTGGIVTTVAGLADEAGIKLGGLPGRLENTSGIAVIDAHTLAVTERYTVLKIVFGTTSAPAGDLQFQSPFDLSRPKAWSRVTRLGDVSERPRTGSFGLVRARR